MPPLRKVAAGLRFKSRSFVLVISLLTEYLLIQILLRNSSPAYSTRLQMYGMDVAIHQHGWSVTDQHVNRRWIGVGHGRYMHGQETTRIGHGYSSNVLVNPILHQPRTAQTQTNGFDKERITLCIWFFHKTAIAINDLLHYLVVNRLLIDCCLPNVSTIPVQNGRVRSAFEE